MLVERDHDWRALGLAQVFDPCVHNLAERIEFSLCGCFCFFSLLLAVVREENKFTHRKPPQKGMSE